MSARNKPTAISFAEKDEEDISAAQTKMKDRLQRHEVRAERRQMRANYRAKKVILKQSNNEMEKKELMMNKLVMKLSKERKNHIQTI